MNWVCILMYLTHFYFYFFVYFIPCDSIVNLYPFNWPISLSFHFDLFDKKCCLDIFFPRKRHLIFKHSGLIDSAKQNLPVNLFSQKYKKIIFSCYSYDICSVRDNPSLNIAFLSLILLFLN